MVSLFATNDLTLNWKLSNKENKERILLVAQQTSLAIMRLVWEKKDEGEN
jgi:uncharacterized protein YdgA (DUF945 family)